jgi:Resolvase, N terminal domain
MGSRRGDGVAAGDEQGRPSSVGRPLGRGAVRDHEEGLAWRRRLVLGAIYTRKSTTDAAGENASTSIQRDSCLAYAAKQEWSVVRVYDEGDGRSGAESADRRPAQQELLRDARCGAFSRLIERDRARLGRDVEGLRKSERLLGLDGSEVWTAEGKQIKTRTGEDLADALVEVVEDRIAGPFSRSRSTWPPLWA